MTVEAKRAKITKRPREFNAPKIRTRPLERWQQSEEDRIKKMFGNIIEILLPHLDLKNVHSQRETAEAFVREHCEPVCFSELEGPVFGIQYKTDSEIMRLGTDNSMTQILMARIEELHSKTVEELLLNSISNSRRVRSDSGGWEKARLHALLPR